MPRRVFECSHVRIMLCEYVTKENRESRKIDEICNQCPYHKPGRHLFCFYEKRMMIAA